MPRLGGSHPQTIDDRSRLAVPAKLVPALREIEGAGPKDNLEVVITITKQERLGVYPRSVFMEMIDKLEEAPSSDVDAEELRLTYLNYMDEQVLDKQNRFRIPAAHAAVFGLNGEVMIVGSGEYLEVVTKETWMEQLKSRMSRLREQDAAVRGASPRKRPSGENGEEEQPR